MMRPAETIFFTSCDAGYLEFAVTSLLTIREQLPGANLAIIGDGYSEKDRAMLEKYNITHINKSYRKEFYKTWAYPVECYYIFAGPEELYKLGYKYSVYLDSDVVCLANPLLREPPVGCAGVSGKSAEQVFCGDGDKLKKIYKLKTQRLTAERINSGVVYFNNELCAKKKLLALAARYFDECIKNKVPRKGDDSLFTLIQVKDFMSDELRILDNRYNFIPEFNAGVQTLAADIVFFHFATGGVKKPWDMGYKDKRYERAYKTWRKEYRKNFGMSYIKARLKTLRPLVTLRDAIGATYYTLAQHLKARHK